jgi:sugar phosphate permease
MLAVAASGTSAAILGALLPPIPTFARFFKSETEAQAAFALLAWIALTLVIGYFATWINVGPPDTVGGGPLSVGWDSQAITLTEGQREQQAMLAELSNVVVDLGTEVEQLRRRVLASLPAAADMTETEEEDG